MNYRGDFLSNHSDRIKDKIVLECAAGAGLISENIMELNPAKYYVSDYKGSALFAMNPFKIGDNIQSLEIDILRDLPEFYRSVTVDTVVCAGYLYHTCHTAWAIEQLLFGRPKNFYIETHCKDNFTYILEKQGTAGAHNKYNGSIPYCTTYHSKFFEDIISSLNYKLVDKFDRAMLYDINNFQADPKYLDEYYPNWFNTTGWWFELE